MIKGLFEKLIKKIQTSDNKPLEDSIKQLEVDKEQLEKDNNTLMLRNISLNKELISEKKKMEDLLNSDNLDINSLRSWYEGRRVQSRWLYDGVRLGDVDVKLYLRPSDNKPFIALAEELIVKYSLSKDMEEYKLIEAVYKYWNLRKNWTYAFDIDQHGVKDYWEDSTKVLASRRDDCENKAMVMFNTIKQLFILMNKQDSFWRITFVAATLVGYTGHGFLTWLHKDGEYYIIESTYDSIDSFRKTWLHTPMRYNNLYKKPWGFSTDEKSWIGTNSALISFSEVQ